MRYLFLFIILCVAIPYTQALPADSTCTLTGDIRGLGNRRIIFRCFPDTSSYHADTIRAKHGHFVFTTHLDAPTYYSVTTLRNHTRKSYKHTGYSVARRGKYGSRYGTYRDMLLENRSMEWKTTLNDFPRSAISNAPLNDTMMYIENIATRVYHSDAALHRWNKQNPIPWKKIIPARRLIERDSISQALYRRECDSIAAYIMAHPSSYASAYTLWRVMYSDHSVREAAYSALETSLRHLPSVENYKKRLEMTGGRISRGDMAPEISLADTSGSIVALSSVRGKVTLVDFWASWCGPCRAENPNVVSVYRKYHKKGLEIYSVSLDNDKSKWKAAIQHDKLKWKHVSGLKGWDDPYVKIYGVGGIPDNFLLDKNGKVIATNLRGKELSALLGQVLK